MKVLMIVYTLYPFDARVQREAETLVRDMGLEVEVLSLKEGSKPRCYTLRGVKVTELDESKYRGQGRIAYILSYFKFMLLAFIKCSASFIRRTVDIVHVHNMPNFLVFSAMIPRLFGKPLILDLHDSVPETFGAKFNRHSSWLFKALCIEEKVSCKIVQHLICVNHIQQDIIISRGLPLDKITILLNVPDPNWFSNNDVAGKHVNKNGFKIVYHGTITKRLGVDLAVTAMHKLKSEIENLEFDVWGAGEARDECIQLSESLGVADIVHFYLPLPIEVLAKKLTSMDLGVIPNRNSAATDLMLPVKLLEYVALGIPVVAPRLKAIQYYFREDMVSFYEPENVDSMAKAILRLYENPSLRKEQAEKAKAFLDKYGWEKHKYDLINIYKQL